MRLPRVRPLTIATVAVATALMLLFFPPFPPDDAAGSPDPEGVPLHLFLGMTLAALLFGDWYGGPGIRGWIDSALATLAIVLIGTTISMWIYTAVENVISREWEGFLRLLVEFYLAGQFAGLAVFLYLFDWDHLGGLALATMVLHFVGRYERSREISEL